MTTNNLDVDDVANNNEEPTNIFILPLMRRDRVHDGCMTGVMMGVMGEIMGKMMRKTMGKVVTCAYILQYRSTCEVIATRSFPRHFRIWKSQEVISCSHLALIRAL